MCEGTVSRAEEVVRDGQENFVGEQNTQIRCMFKAQFVGVETVCLARQ